MFDWNLLNLVWIVCAGFLFGAGMAISSKVIK